MNERDIVREIAERVAERLAEANREIVGARVYPDHIAATLIGLEGKHRARVIRDLPIPQIPITAGGRRIGYLGSDLLAYLQKVRIGLAA